MLRKNSAEYVVKLKKSLDFSDEMGDEIDSNSNISNAPVIHLPCGHCKFFRWALPIYSRCQWCNRKLNMPGSKRGKAGATRDHIVPRKKRGSSTLDNLVLACNDCNSLRGCKDISPKRKLYGPRWNCIPDIDNVVRVVGDIDGLCKLWMRKDELWYPIHVGNWENCENQRKKMIGSKKDVMIVPNNVIFKKCGASKITGDELMKKIAETAYQRWLASGCQHGYHVNHWLASEREVKALYQV